MEATASAQKLEIVSDACGMINDALRTLDDDAINTLYWHDTLHNYSAPEATTIRLEVWDDVLTDCIDPLVAEGRVEWKTFREMADLYPR